MKDNRKILFISDILSSETSGALVMTNSHLSILRKIYGYENVRIIALTGNKNLENDEYTVLKNKQIFIMKILNLAFGNTGKINNAIINTIINIVKKENILRVFIDDSFYGNLTERLKKQNKNIQIASYYADVKASLCRQWIKNNIIKTPVYLSMIQGEKKNQKYCNVNLVLNEREKKLFEKHYHNYSSSILKIFMKVNEYKKLDVKFSTPLKLLFVGAYYYPNIKGIDWFIKNVFQKLNIDARLTIVGNGMDALKDKYSSISNIEVFGRVDDLSIYYINSDIIVGPIFEGGGMKVKTAEAFAFGKCYIGSEESLMGYYEDLTQELKNKYILRCNTANDFINAIYTMVNNNELLKYNDIIYRLYNENYSEEAAENIVRHIFE